MLLADHQKRLRSPKLRDKCGKLWKKEACYERTDIVGRVHHIVSYGRGTRSFVYASETYVYKRLSDSASFRNECQWQIMNEGRSVAVFPPVWWSLDTPVMLRRGPELSSTSRWMVAVFVSSPSVLRFKRRDQTLMRHRHSYFCHSIGAILGYLLATTPT